MSIANEAAAEGFVEAAEHNFNRYSSIILHGLRVYRVVLPMGPDEPDMHDAVGVVDPSHDAILVPGNVEHTPRHL
jgi:hypothetical protein